MKLSVIIPVLNESDRINRTLDALLDLPYSDTVEIIVVDGNPSGNTISAITHRTVKQVVAPTGRGIQMTTGAHSASGDILLFLHADTRLPDAAFSIIAETCNDDAFVGGAFDLGIDSTRRWFRLIERVASLRSRLTRIPYGDQGIYIRRCWFDKLGGFKDIPVMEDVDLMNRLKRSGGKLHISSDRVNTSSRRWDREGALFCTFRNWMLLGLFFMGVDPVRLEPFYRMK